MASQIARSAFQRRLLVQSELLHEVGELSVFRSDRLDGVAVQAAHQPVIACYDTPVQNESGRWVWAVCLGGRVAGGVIRTLALRRYCFPGRGDRRFGWLYRGDWESEEARRRIRVLAAEMQQQLEESLAATVGRGALVYVAPRGEPVVKAHSHGRVGTDELVLVLAAEVAACRLREA